MSKNRYNSFNINDYYIWYKHNRPKDSKYYLTEKQHNAIIKAVFLALAEELVSGKAIQLGPYLGVLEMCEYTFDDRIWIDKNGKFHDHRPVDWDIWNKKQKGLLPKNVSHKWFKPIPIIIWRKARTARLRNKKFLGFYVSNSLKKKAQESFNNNELCLRNANTMYSKKERNIYNLWNRKE